MGLPSHHLLPKTTFRHIGVMVMFMSIMAAFCTIGYISVHDITRGWLVDIDNSLNIEIPSFNGQTKQIIPAETITNNITSIEDYLANDPLVGNIKIDRPDDIQIADIDEFAIPAPAFITISLRPDRANNAEDRLVNNIQNIAPNAIVKNAEEWEKSIQKTAYTLSIIFGGLTVAIFIITSILLSAIIKIQLRAHDETVQIIHLMGASSRNISSLFKSSITRPVLTGNIVGLGFAVLIFSPIMMMLNLEGNIPIFYASVGIIFFTFLILCRWVTHWTVMKTLRSMP